MTLEGKPTVPDVLERFVAYRREHGPEWDSLHIVLADDNMDDSDVAFCIDWAKKEGDREGAALAEILLRMSKTQRKKIQRRVWEVFDAERKAGALPR